MAWDCNKVIELKLFLDQLEYYPHTHINIIAGQLFTCIGTNRGLQNYYQQDVIQLYNSLEYTVYLCLR